MTTISSGDVKRLLEALWHDGYLLDLGRLAERAKGEILTLRSQRVRAIEDLEDEVARLERTIDEQQDTIDQLEDELHRLRAYRNTSDSDH